MAIKILFSRIYQCLGTEGEIMLGAWRVWRLVMRREERGDISLMLSLTSLPPDMIKTENRK
jgi:hypothetical protein